ncbi:hypothetical protein A9Q93_05095 [Nonlabens dokdonensis]|uniref:Uncharacterized protein n=1 Tax=Nonlabens dokdonensis TaxID=328515 RepID=A0A1Z8B387_9FLAO|nr:hypothetical protein [Nonlabens dokdonensis]OUS17059.1 hypothetical protein A9Q93_05095 [Nonlabens dokdonensis]
MAYKSFNVQQVFAIPSLNILCDRLINFNSDLFLTGAAATMINGDATVAATRAVIFITSDKILFSSLKNELPKLWAGAAIISLSDRYLIDIYNLKLEIWLSTKSIVSTTVDGIKTQATNDIPSNLL